MEKSGISRLALNAIKDARTTIDNYAYFNDTDSDGLSGDTFKAKSYIGSLENYYAGSSCLEDALSYLHSYYEPYVSEFEAKETLGMWKAKKFTRGCLYGAAVITLASAVVSYFFPIAFTLSTLALVSHIYVKTREMQRAGTLKHLKINDEEAKSIKLEELSDVLDSDKEIVLEALAKDYTFQQETLANSRLS